MQYDIRGIIFFAIALGIVAACIYVLDKIVRQYPVDYSETTYSYKKILRGTLIGLFLALVISLFVYVFSKSFELTVSLGAFFLCFVLAYLVWGLYWQHFDRRRGARRED